jgi:hypothetical protein
MVVLLKIQKEFLYTSPHPQFQNQFNYSILSIYTTLLIRIILSNPRLDLRNLIINHSLHSRINSPILHDQIRAVEAPGNNLKRVFWCWGEWAIRTELGGHSGSSPGVEFTAHIVSLFTFNVERRGIGMWKRGHTRSSRLDVRWYRVSIPQCACW